jgi:hypothetical protein
MRAGRAATCRSSSGQELHAHPAGAELREALQQGREHKQHEEATQGVVAVALPDLHDHEGEDDEEEDRRQQPREAVGGDASTNSRAFRPSLAKRILLYRDRAPDRRNAALTARLNQRPTADGRTAHRIGGRAPRRAPGRR